MAGSRETVPAREATVPSPAPASSPAEPNLFSRVSVGRISEIIVEQIRLLMRQGQLKPGDRLPPERDLCERFGVSRVTVREALRTLDRADWPRSGSARAAVRSSPCPPATGLARAWPTCSRFL